jgi:hypothetical protein
MRYRDALSSFADRIGRSLTASLFPEDATPHVIQVGPPPAMRKRPQRDRRPPPMSRVMPRMGYRYHMSWMQPESALKRWWRKASRHPEAGNQGDSR